MRVNQTILSMVLAGIMAIAVMPNSLAEDENYRPAPVRPQRPATDGPGPIDWRSLNLTPDQVRRINSLRLGFQKTAIRLKAEIESRKVEIERELIAPSSDSDRLRAIMREKIELDGKLQMAALENFLAIKAVLTVEQLNKLPSVRMPY